MDDWRYRRPRRKLVLFFLATVFLGVVSYFGFFLSSVRFFQYTKVKEAGRRRATPTKVWTAKDYTVHVWLPRRIRGERDDRGSEEAEGGSYNTPRSRGMRQKGNLIPMTLPEIPIPPREAVTSATDGRRVLPSKRLPQALIIGVKKSGTRALLEFLRLHPDVRAAGPETHFFDRFYHRGLEWYREQMPSSLSGHITMEKTPSYFITREVPRRIHAMSPSVKLIVVVRDPVTRAISDYTQTASKRRWTHSFEELAFQNASTGLVDTSWSAIRIGVYARYVAWWLDYFRLDQIHFVSGETLVQNPAKEMARLQDFLGLQRMVGKDHFYYNETKGFPCWRRGPEDSVHCLGKNKGRSHPNIPEATTQRLRDFFRPFNTKFYKMVGVDFGWP